MKGAKTRVRPQCASSFCLHPSSLRRTGLGLVELLVSLAIVAALLTAAAYAVRASVRAYGINQSEADLTGRARLALERIAAHVRASREHAPVTADAAARFAAGERVVDAGVALFAPEPDGRSIAFAHDAASRSVTMTVGGGPPAVLLRGVARFEVTLEPMRSAEAVKAGGGHDRLRRATILLTLDPAPLPGESAGRPVTYSASVVPRGNVW